MQNLILLAAEEGGVLGGVELLLQPLERAARAGSLGERVAALGDAALLCGHPLLGEQALKRVEHMLVAQVPRRRANRAICCSMISMPS